MILAIDIGGTKTAFGIFEAKNPEHPPCFEGKLPTKKGLKGVQETLQTIQNTCTQNGYSIERVGIGCPGRMVGYPNPILSPGSAKQLESHPDEWANLAVQPFFESCFPEKPVVVLNDGVTQWVGGWVMAGKPQGKWGYFGIGTGLGGAFGTFDATGIHSRTDGHIFDIKLEKGLGAEAILSGKGFQTLVGIEAKTLNEHPEKIPHYTPQLTQFCGYLVKLLTQLYAGTHSKTTHQREWPQTDKDFVKGIDHYFWGGSLGTKGALGTTLQTITQALLEGQNEHFKLVPITNPERAALVGAAIASLGAVDLTASSLA
ncbi:MAG: ROK family protein [Candidatus Margulisiibacteriota bacterium]